MNEYDRRIKTNPITKPIFRNVCSKSEGEDRFVSNLGLTRFNKCEDVARHKTGTREGGRGWRKHKMAFALLTIRPEDQASVGKVQILVW